DAVPTCVVRGEGGLLVGELSGRLIRVQGTSFSPVVVKDAAGNSLLTHVTGCTSDGRGNVYFVNMFGSGAPFTPPPTSNFFFGNVVQYNTETGKASVLADHLNFPNMAAVGPDGNLYVSTAAIGGSTGVAGPPCFGATGSVTRITLAHGENDWSRQLRRRFAGFVEPVKRAELLLHVGDPRFRRQRLARGALHELVRRELAAVPVHVLAQPAEQRGELAPLDLRVEVGKLDADLFHQLRPDQVAD